MLGLAIRKAEERDLPQIMEIECSSFPTPWPEGLLRQYLGEEGFLVCEQDGRVVGYILVGLRIPSLLSRLERRTRRLLGHHDDDEPELHVGHIMNLAVARGQRRRGLGSALLQAGLDYLRSLGARTVELEVRVSNDPAIRLYQRFGFTIARRMPRYYSDGSDAYLMRLSLR